MLDSLLGLIPATDNAGLDFLAFAGQLSPLVLGLWSTGSGSWAVVSLVPDVGTAPAVKMLNAASRKDLKTVLGASSFNGEFHACHPSELTFEAVAMCHRRDADAAKSAAEVQRDAERLAESSERSSHHAAVSVPFSFTNQLADACASFARGDLALVEAGISGETLHMLSSEERVTLDGVVAKLSPEPRFLVVRPCDGTIAVCLFVPESAKPGVKMLYATAKAAFLSRLEELGVKGTAQLQCTDESDIRTDLGRLFVAVGGGGSGAGGAEEGAGFSRPARPGRGRARVIGASVPL